MLLPQLQPLVSQTQERIVLADAISLVIYALAWVGVGRQGGSLLWIYASVSNASEDCNCSNPATSYLTCNSQDTAQCRTACSVR